MSNRAECRKFAPNIFNQSKCTNCFRQREEHTAQALECNRVTRKVSKCGYLFVAPDWDFTNPLYRTKRWQRRWFVLYDDGELSYSVDEHPDTVPQASIDMNKVLEVADAEDVTGNAFSLAVTAPDRVHFVKGTCREEARWWADVLAVFPKSKGRHKRNATFPGGQTSSNTLQPGASNRNGTSAAARPRYNSCHSEPAQRDVLWSEESPKRAPLLEHRPLQSEIVCAVPAIDIRQVYTDQPMSSASPPTRDKIHSEDKARSRRDKRSPRSTRPPRPPQSTHSVQEDYGEALSAKWLEQKAAATVDTTDGIQASHLKLLDEYEQQSKREEKLRDIAASLTSPRSWRSSRVSKKFVTGMGTATGGARSGRSPAEKPTRDEGPQGNVSRVQPINNGNNIKAAAINTDYTERKLVLDDSNKDIDSKQVRGDPDGCNLDFMNRYSPSAELRVELPAEDLLNIKKGWLMKQGRAPSLDWNKYWFVLRDAALMFYRDPTAEDRGVMDGVIDVNSVSSIMEMLVVRNYGFQIVCWDNRKFVLSAVTAGIRANWMSAIRRASGLSDVAALPDASVVIGEKLEHELLSSSQANRMSPTTDTEIIPTTPLTSRVVLFSSDDEYRTASEGGRRDSIDWTEGLPPSPPIARIPISRVKDRARSRSSSGTRVYKRSRSSPPSSRCSTLDSVRTEDLLLACCELPESECDETIKTSVNNQLVKILEHEIKSLREQLEHPQLLPTSDKYGENLSMDIDELNKQLNVALCDLNDAEQELVRLRQLKAQSTLREKRMEELLSTLERTEQELNKHTSEAGDMDAIRKMYHQDKEAWETKLEESQSYLQESTQRCSMLTREITTSHNAIQDLRREVDSLNERLSKGIDENDSLYKKVRDLEGRAGSLSASRDRGRSMDSLSDLTNIDYELNFYELNKDRIIEEYEELRGRFEKAIQEIRAMKKELRDSHALYDDLELVNLSLQNEVKQVEENDQAEISLMAARIQDLTQKLSNSEKQSRSLKQKVQKSESREKRRSLSLKGRESLTIGKEVEEKLLELENKIITLESGRGKKSASPKTVSSSSRESPIKERSLRREMSNEERSLKRASVRLRRKSLDSVTSAEPMQVLIRLSCLESKVNSASQSGCSSHNDSIANSTDSLDLSISENSSDLNSIDPKQHLVDRLQCLEAVVVTSKDKVAHCLEQFLTLKSSKTRRSVSPLSDRKDTMRFIEKYLVELNKILKESCEKCVVPYDVGNCEPVRHMLLKLQNNLKLNLNELLVKRRILKESSQLSPKAELELLSQKIAFEKVYINQIDEAMKNSDSNDDFINKFLKSEIVETSQLISDLYTKLNGKNVQCQSEYTLSIDTLANLLTKKLIVTRYLNDLSNSDQQLSGSSNLRSAILDQLLKQQKELEGTMERYQSIKVDELAHTLALEVLSSISDSSYDQKKMTEVRIQEAWKMAQHTVNTELIQFELTHVVKRCTQVYGGSLKSSQVKQICFIPSQQTLLEHWADAAQERLHSEMDTVVSLLTSAYEASFVKLKQQYSGQWRLHVELDRNMAESKRTLSELADIVAHKALIDSRISILTSSYTPSHTMVADDSMSLSKMLKYPSLFNDICEDLDMEIEADYLILNQFYKNQCLLSMNNDLCDPLNEVVKSIDSLDKIVFKLQHKLNPNNNMDCIALMNISNQLVNWDAIHKKCSELQSRLEGLLLCLQGKKCEQCLQLQDTVHRLRLVHEKELVDFRKNQEADLTNLQTSLKQHYEQEQAQLRGEHVQLRRLVSQHEQDRTSLTQHHEQAQAELKERARKLEKRLGTLDSEYSQQLDNLRSAYHKTLSAGLERDVDGEENLRHRYQAEIEQLRALCEKGLIAMESSHWRIVTELEDKHRTECEQLMSDKEQALAEETQATLAALDAMRKAHESEVQREITKFKQEFMKQMQTNSDLSSLHKEQQEELEEIRHEILSLSDRYSVKCVESANLEEKLIVSNKQLAQAQAHIMQLDARNKQLRAHLLNEASELSQLQLLQLQDKCFTTMDNAHVDQMVVSVKGKPKDKMLTNRPRCERPNHMFTGLRSQVSVPSRCSPALVSSVALGSRQVSPCPLIGMVAERKKRFEFHY